MTALEVAVDDLGPLLLILAPGDPHLLEGLEGREDGPAEPDRVHAFRGRDDLDVHGLRDLFIRLLPRVIEINNK